MLVPALRRAADRAAARPPRENEAFAPPPPWGPLALSPREAFLGPQEVVPVADAVGRVAAESLAAYPPGIPNVLPGERLSAETIEYVQKTLEQGGYLRGASDRRLRTLRVVGRVLSWRLAAGGGWRLAEVGGWRLAGWGRLLVG